MHQEAALRLCGILVELTLLPAVKHRDNERVKCQFKDRHRDLRALVLEYVATC